jgi:hypothetical protein
MIAPLEKLITRYRHQGLLIDTNLLILYCIGTLNQELIATFKRTKPYVKEDYETLVHFMRYFSKIVTTPNVLTEVSNLANSLHSQVKDEFYQIFSKIITRVEENYMPSKQVSDTQELYKFGLTDSVIFYLAKGNYLLLTDDFRLSQYVESKHYDAINFNHIRMLNWR